MILLKRLPAVGLLMLLAAPALGGVNDGGTKALSSPATNVIDYLVADWKHRFHSTTIPHAMENLGMAVNDDLRLEVLNHFSGKRGQPRNIQYWGANNYLLTNTEKRIAKLLLNMRRDTGELPSAAEARKIIGLTQSELKDRLAFMAQAGFLTADKGQSLGYDLAEDAEIWGGPLRHNYHTIMPEGEDKYDVW